MRPLYTSGFKALLENRISDPVYRVSRDRERSSQPSPMKSEPWAHFCICRNLDCIPFSAVNLPSKTRSVTLRHRDLDRKENLRIKSPQPQRNLKVRGAPDYV